MTDNGNEKFAQAFLQETRQALAQEHRRIAHSLGQLDESQIWQRPSPDVNSIGTIIVHLCGNLRQRFLHGIGGAEDVRNRPSEFTGAATFSKQELLATLNELIRKIDALLQDLPVGVLLAPRRIQGEETVGLAVIYRTVTHLEGHALQIAYVTHTLVGDRYEPFWKPANAEQGSL